MKRFFAAALMLAILVPSSHAGDYWVTVGSPVDEADDSFVLPVVAVDASTLVYDGPNRKVWTYNLFVKGATLVEVGAVRYSFHCNQQEGTAIQETQYDPNNLGIASAGSLKESGYASPIPGTLPDSVLKFVCDQRAGTVVGSENAHHFKNEGAGDLSHLKAIALRWWKFAESYRKLPKNDH